MYRSRIHMACLAAVAGLAGASGGCKEGGAMLYFLTQSMPKKVDATYRLPAGPVMVLVDDDQGLIQPPLARYALVDAMARELKEHNITDKVTTNEEIARLRQAEPKYDQRGARELGRMAEVKTVLLLSTQAFVIEDDLEMSATPAKFAVTVRVIDAKAEEAKKVRLWPSETEEREGHLVEATVKPHELRQLKTMPEAHAKMAAALATEIVNLFYDRKEEQ